jgi:hypothetical protein
MADTGLPRFPGSRARRATLIGGLAALLVVFVAVWVLPNVAGPAFVEVRVLVAARASTAGPVVTVGSVAPGRASALDVGVEVVNHYPLGVVVGTNGSSFQATAYRRGDTGKLTSVWHTSVDDPALEEGSDSPVGGGSSAGAAAVPSGVTRHDLTRSSTGFSLVDATGAPLATGVYYLRVWAYGIASPLVPIAIDDGPDPLGTTTG